MKKQLLFLTLLISFFSIELKAQEWEALGPDDFNQASTLGVTDLSIATDPAGTPYIAYKDISLKAIVKKWDGTTWVSLEEQNFSNPSGGQLNLAIAPDGTPFLAYTDQSLDKRVTVKKWDGVSWEIVGTAGISAGGASYLNLAIDPSGFPYVAYGDSENSSRATVKKWNGTDWLDVGVGGISSGLAAQICFTFDPAGTPYIAYSSGKGIVKKWNEVTSTWEDVGSEGFSTGIAYDISLDFISSGLPYVAYSDGGNQKRVTVKKWDGSAWTGISSTGLRIGQSNDITLAIDRSGSSDILYLSYRILGADESYKGFVERLDGNAWVNLGTSPYSELSVDFFSLNIGPSGTPIIAYTDELLNKKAIVKEWTGSSWLDLGSTGFSLGTASYISMVISSSNTIYVGYSEGIKGKATVQKWNGIAWEVVGIPGFSEAGAASCSIGLDNLGNPVLAYSDGRVGGMDDKVTVKQWNGSAWNTMGIRGFSTGQAYSISLAFDPSGTPYVAYSDVDLGRKSVVKKWNGTAWENVGIAGFSAGGAYSISLAIDQSGIPYIAYSDDNNGRLATVKNWDGNTNTWNDVGIPGVSAGTSYFNTIAFDPNGLLFLAYRDGVNNNRPTVKKWFENQWEVVGNEGLSPRLAQYISLDFSPTGTPYISYSNSQGTGYVEKWNGITWDDVSSENYSPGGVKYSDMSINSSGELIISYSNPIAFAKKFDVGVTTCNAPIPDNEILADVRKECEATLTAPNAANDCGDTFTATTDIDFPITTQGTTEITWIYDDGNGNSVTQTQNVIIEDITPPVITYPADIEQNTDTGICDATVNIIDPTATDNCTSTLIIAGVRSDALELTDPYPVGETTITWIATDEAGNDSDPGMQKIIITDDEAPMPNLAILPDVLADCEVIELTEPTATDNCEVAVNVTNDATLPINTQGTTIVTWTYDDGHGNTVTQTQNVILNNQVPVLSNLSVHLDLVRVNSSVSLSVDYDDNNLSEALIDWGDGLQTYGEIDTGVITTDHMYTTPGVYILEIYVTDDCGETASLVYQYIVVYDSSGGFVTGGGWINSPAGAYVDDPLLTGKANFGFVAKYKKGQTVPTGNTEFQFKAGDLNFNSSSFDWLIIAGSKAKFKGEGTINGTGLYGFMISAIDEDSKDKTDKFRIKIWEMPNEFVVYDNQNGAEDNSDPTTEIGGGAIVVHSGTKGSDQSKIVADKNTNELNVYPNPFSETTNIELSTLKSKRASIEVYDLYGRLVERLYDGQINSDTNNLFEFNKDNNLSPGVYIVRVILDNNEVHTKNVLLVK